MLLEPSFGDKRFNIPFHGDIRGLGERIQSSTPGGGVVRRFKAGHLAKPICLAHGL